MWRMPLTPKATRKGEMLPIETVKWVPLEGDLMDLRAAVDRSEHPNAYDPVAARELTGAHDEIAVGDHTPSVIVLQICRQRAIIDALEPVIRGGLNRHVRQCSDSKRLSRLGTYSVRRPSIFARTFQ